MFVKAERCPLISSHRVIPTDMVNETEGYRKSCYSCGERQAVQYSNGRRFLRTDASAMPCEAQILTKEKGQRNKGRSEKELEENIHAGRRIVGIMLIKEGR